MKTADFFETSHFLENGETADNNPPAIFFNGGVKMRKTVQIIAILMMLVLMFAGVSVAGIPAAERDALTELYNSTDGANWTNNTSWADFLHSQTTISTVMQLPYKKRQTLNSILPKKAGRGSAGRIWRERICETRHTY